MQNWEIDLVKLGKRFDVDLIPSRDARPSAGETLQSQLHRWAAFEDVLF